MWESCVNRPFIYITHSRNVDNREIDITAVPRARCSAMSPLPRICIQAYADKQHRRARAALECIKPPEGLNRRDTPTSPDSRSVFAFTDVPAVCFPPPIGESQGQGLMQPGCTDASARRRFFGILPSFSKLCIYIDIYAPLLRVRTVSKDFYCQKSVK